MSSRRGFLRERIRQLGTGHVGLGLRPMSVTGAYRAVWGPHRAVTQVG